MLFTYGCMHALHTLGTHRREWRIIVVGMGPWHGNFSLLAPTGKSKIHSRLNLISIFFLSLGGAHSCQPRIMHVVYIPFQFWPGSKFHHVGTFAHETLSRCFVILYSTKFRITAAPNAILITRRENLFTEPAFVCVWMRQIFGFEARKFPSNFFFFICDGTGRREKKKDSHYEAPENTAADNGATRGRRRRQISRILIFLVRKDGWNGREEAERWKNKRLIRLLTSSSFPENGKTCGICLHATKLL